MSNRITIVGTIATDPKSIKTQSGVEMCTFRVASSERRFDQAQQKWVDGETNWFGVTTFRSLATHSLESFRKGERIIVAGRLRLRTWENTEKSGTSVDIEADAIGHDLRWGVSSFEKRTPSSTGATPGPLGGESETSVTTAEPGGTDPHASFAESLGEAEPRGTDGFVPAAA